MKKYKELILHHPWRETKDKILHAFVLLPGYDLRYEKGKEHVFIQRLWKKMKKNSRLVKNELNHICIIF